MSSLIAKATYLCLVTFLFFGNYSFANIIIPEDVVSFQHIILTNLPRFKIGTDSRVGIGFRLGEHIDAQILTEYGPQKDTKPIGNTKDIKNKRNAMMKAALTGEFGPWSQAIARFQMSRKYKKFLNAQQLRTKNVSTDKTRNSTKSVNK